VSKPCEVCSLYRWHGCKCCACSYTVMGARTPSMVCPVGSHIGGHQFTPAELGELIGHEMGTVMAAHRRTYIGNY